MKKLLVALLAISIAFSALSITAFAEEATGDAAQNTETAQETKTVDSLVGAFYLQGESGSGLLASGEQYQSTYDYQVADKFAAALKGTNRIPFYAFDKDGDVYFDAFAEDYLISEANAAKAAGIDFFAYRYYAGYDNTSGNPIRNMNNQLIRHTSIYGNAEFSSKLNYALVLDGDFNASKTKERNIIVDRFLIMKGYLTAEDGRPVVFIIWNDDISNQISRLNKDLKKAVEDGANEKKTSAPKTALNDDVEKMYVVALNAPSYDEAVAAGADAVSWYEGTGKNGEAYTSMTATVEAKWTSSDKNVVPNVVTGYDLSLLADNPIEITALKASNDKTTTVRYSRTGTKEDTVAAATADELVAHIKNAVATTNKPAEFGAVMVYAWDDFMGGAYLCPTKTDKQYQYNTEYLDAMRNYFYGKTDGMPALTVLDNSNNTVVTDSRAKTITTSKGDEVLAKVDFDGKDLLAGTTGTQSTDDPGTTTTSDDGNDYTLYIIIGAAAVVVILVVVIIIAAASKKKKASKAEEPKAE